MQKSEIIFISECDDIETYLRRKIRAEK